jgi:Fe-S oxidoreductase
MATLNQTSMRQTPPQDLKIGLFMPCYVDVIYPKAGIAILELLEKFGLDVDYPLNQTCCGQPMSNSGDQVNARGAEQLFVDIFKGYDCIIGPGRKLRQASALSLRRAGSDRRRGAGSPAYVRAG